MEPRSCLGAVAFLHPVGWKRRSISTTDRDVHRQHHVILGFLADHLRRKKARRITMQAARTALSGDGN